MDTENEQRHGRRPEPGPVRAGFDSCLLAASTVGPAALAFVLSFHQGGSPPGVAAVAAAIVGALLLTRLIAAPATVVRPGRTGTVAVVALAGLLGWTVLSAAWSQAPARSLAEASRVALYTVVFAGTITLPAAWLRWLLRSAAWALAAVALLGLLSRCAAGLVPTAAGLSESRLAYPIGYWNALAVVVAGAFVLHLHLAADALESRAQRWVAAALLPALATTVYLTGSRAGIGVTLIGTVAYLAIARSRTALFTTGAVAIPTAIAVLVAWHSTALITTAWRTAPGQGEGHRLLAALLVCGVVAAVLRSRLERHQHRALPSLKPSPRARRALALATTAFAVAALVVVASDAPAAIERQYGSFVASAPASSFNDPRDRLTSTYNNGRLALWDTALRNLSSHPLTGSGAGTFGREWSHDRPDISDAPYAHSLYVQTLGELGVAGLALLAGWLLASVLVAVGVPRPSRPLVAAAASVLILWAAQAAVEWTWQVPAVTVVPVALGAAVVGSRSAGRLRRGARVVAAVVVGAVVAFSSIEAMGQARVTGATRAYNAADCATALRTVDVVTDIAPWQPEPYVLRGLCAARAGDRATARAAIGEAVRRDPQDWRMQIDRGIVEAVTGGDPRPAFALADRLNPNEVDAAALDFIAAREQRSQWAATSRAKLPYVGDFTEMPIGPGNLCLDLTTPYWRWTTYTFSRCEPSTPGLWRWRMR